MHGILSLSLGREVFRERDQLLSEFALMVNESGTASALEVFVVLYLCGCLDLGFEEKLDAIISIVQFQPMPSVRELEKQDGVFVSAKPLSKCTRDDIYFAMDVMVVIALCRAASVSVPPSLLSSQETDHIRRLRHLSTRAALAPSSTPNQQQSHLHNFSVDEDRRCSRRRRDDGWCTGEIKD